MITEVTKQPLQLLTTTAATAATTTITTILLLLLLHPLNGLFSRTIWLSRYQKGKMVWI